MISMIFVQCGRHGRRVQIVHKLRQSPMVQMVGYLYRAVSEFTLALNQAGSDSDTEPKATDGYTTNLRGHLQSSRTRYLRSRKSLYHTRGRDESVRSNLMADKSRYLNLRGSVKRGRVTISDRAHIKYNITLPILKMLSEGGLFEHS
jgi:hypothetical protein